MNLFAVESNCHSYNSEYMAHYHAYHFAGMLWYADHFEYLVLTFIPWWIHGIGIHTTLHNYMSFSCISLWMHGILGFSILYKYRLTKRCSRQLLFVLCVLNLSSDNQCNILFKRHHNDYNIIGFIMHVLFSICTPTNHTLI